jgi:hypothetical protein
MSVICAPKGKELPKRLPSPSAGGYSGKGYVCSCFEEELIRYLFENLYFDFQGDISVDKVREFLREDDSREARQLLSKIIEEKGVDDLLITMADVLKDQIRTGVNEQDIRDQLHTYSES